MPEASGIAGVVLAGGRSSRMGENKAFLDFHGTPLIDHMIGVLKEAQIKDIYISGNYEGYECIPDSAPFSGPAAAIRDVLDRLSGYEGVLLVPVDMPFLTQDILQELLSSKNGAHYEGWPLPLYLPTAATRGQGAAIKTMLSAMDVTVLLLPQDRQEHFANINTPEDWKEAVRT